MRDLVSWERTVEVMSRLTITARSNILAAWNANI
jgi:hypothetical protein